MSWPLSFGLLAPNTLFSLLCDAGAESLRITFLLCQGQGMLEGVCKARGEGRTCSCQLICCSWLSPSNSLHPSTQLVPVVTDSSPPLCSAHPQSASWWAFRDVSSASQHPAPGSVHTGLPVSSRCNNASGTMPFLRGWVPALPTLFQMSRLWKLTILPFIPPALRMLPTSWRYSVLLSYPLCLYGFPVPFSLFLSLCLLFNINNTRRLLGNWADRCPGAP